MIARPANVHGMRILALLAMAFASAPAAGASGSGEPSESDEQQVGLAGRVCGPHCVKWVLARYGVEADLLDLVREMQWPEFEKGSSFAGMEQSLQKRGFCVQALKSPILGGWDVPVIIQETRPAESVAHFAVIDPELGYWDPAELDFSERQHDRYAGYLMAVFPCTRRLPEQSINNFDVALIGGVVGLTMILACLVFVRPRGSQAG